jgi:hypothetical protein
VPKLRGAIHQVILPCCPVNPCIQTREPNGRIMLIQLADYRHDRSPLTTPRRNLKQKKHSFKNLELYCTKSRLQFKSFFRYKTWPPHWYGCNLAARSDHSLNVKHASPHISVQLAAETPCKSSNRTKVKTKHSLLRPRPSWQLRTHAWPLLLYPIYLLRRRWLTCRRQGNHSSSTVPVRKPSRRNTPQGSNSRPWWLGRRDS